MGCISWQEPQASNACVRSRIRWRILCEAVCSTSMCVENELWWELTHSITIAQTHRCLITSLTLSMRLHPAVLVLLFLFRRNFNKWSDAPFSPAGPWNRWKKKLETVTRYRLMTFAGENNTHFPLLCSFWTLCLGKEDVLIITRFTIECVFVLELSRIISVCFDFSLIFFFCRQLSCNNPRCIFSGRSFFILLPPPRTCRVCFGRLLSLLFGSQHAVLPYIMFGNSCGEDTYLRKHSAPRLPRRVPSSIRPVNRFSGYLTCSRSLSGPSPDTGR